MSALPLPAAIRADTAFSARRANYARNQQYYDGEHSFPLRRRPDRGRNYATRNWVALLVDTIVDHMGRPSVHWNQDAAAGSDEQRLDDYLDQVLALNEHEQLDHDLELTAAIRGDAVERVWWDEVENRVRLSEVSPEGVWARTRPEDPRAIELIAQQYELGPGESVTYAGRTITGLNNPDLVTETWTNDTFEVWLGETRQLDIDNPYGLIPYIIRPNQRRPRQLWGLGDPDRLRSLQDQHNQAATDLDWVMEVSSSILVLENVDEEQDIGLRPGAVWDLPADSRAYMLDLLANSGVQQRLWHLEDLAEAMQRIARVPETATAGNQGRAVSGLALQIELGPLLHLIERKRITRASALRRRAQLVAHLGFLFDGQPVVPSHLIPSISWEDALPSDTSADLSNARDWLSIGRSRAAVMAELGVEDPTSELAARHEEDQTLLSIQDDEDENLGGDLDQNE